MEVERAAAAKRSAEDQEPEQRIAQVGRFDLSQVTDDIRSEREQFLKTLQYMHNIQHELARTETKCVMLENYCTNGVRYIQHLQTSATDLESEVNSLAGMIERERKERAMEREGYQKAAK